MADNIDKDGLDEDGEKPPLTADFDQTTRPAEAEEPSDRDTTPSPVDVKAPTISLLDLMDEAGDPEKQADADSAQSGPGIPHGTSVNADVEATPTGQPIPTSLPAPDTPPLPLASSDLKPAGSPPIIDDEATRVQPRSAFPGQTQLHEPVRSGESTESKIPIAGLSTQRRRQSIAEQPTQPLLRRTPIPATRVEAAISPAPATARLPLKKEKGSRWGCAGRIITVGIILVVIGAALGIAGASLGYIIVGSQLPLPRELRARASTFETAQILDRDGQVLYSLADPTAGNRSYVPLSRIDQDLQNATVATEDSRFYTNPGFDPLAIGRSILEAAREGEVSSGASTITQQLARALLLDEEERTQRTFSRKVKEIILAAELYRTYPKEEILELYLNEIYYGNRAYGIEAASQTYFGKSASELSLAEASLLAGLPQAPALWDPFSAPDRALGRQREVLSLMVSEDYISREEAQAAISETQSFIGSLEAPDVTIRYPHFSFTVLQQLEEAIGAQAIYRGGLRIFTTLDPAVQRQAEESVAEGLENLNIGGANNASLVVLDPRTGEVLALVGSVEFNNEAIDGQVNMALAPRQPGSAIKPLVYLTALEEGWTPATLIWDVETQFPDGVNPPYVPKNYDDSFHGPLRLRPALGNSYNVPAVKALEFVGVCNFIQRAQELGLSSLQDQGCQESGQPRDHGLSLALGGGEMSPLELAGAFGVLANGGRYHAPYTITKIEDRDGNLMFEQQPDNTSTSQVARAEHAYLLNDILSDNNARQPEFGVVNNLNVAGHSVAAKTGTSGTDRFDVRDGWTIGYTPEVVAAVWVGNTDYSPVGEGQNGHRLAAPIWQSFMSRFLANRQPSDFPRPAGIFDYEICADSGTFPGSGCTSRVMEIFSSDQPPSANTNDFIQSIAVDLWTNLSANEHCRESFYQAGFVNLLVNGRDDVLVREKHNARQWLETTAAGQAWAAQKNIEIPLKLPPEQACGSETLRPKAKIDFPSQAESVTGEVEIMGSALGPNFTGYRLEYGLSHDPQGWASIQEIRNQTVENGLMARWDTSGIGSGPATIRLIIYGPDNPNTAEEDPVQLEFRQPIFILEPTATPTPTPTDTPTPTNTPTPTYTSTPTDTPTPTNTPTPTYTSTPTDTPTPTPTNTPSPADTPGSPYPPPQP